MYSERSYLLFRTMSNRWEHELQRCLDGDIDFPVAKFIMLHSEVPPPTIRQRHAQLRATLMKRLQKRTALGIQAATVANLNTRELQAAKGSCGGKKNTAVSQVAKGSCGGKKNTAVSQAAKGSCGGKKNNAESQANKGKKNTAESQANKGKKNTAESQAAKGSCGGIYGKKSPPPPPPRTPEVRGGGDGGEVVVVVVVVVAPSTCRREKLPDTLSLGRAQGSSRTASRWPGVCRQRPRGGGRHGVEGGGARAWRRLGLPVEVTLEPSPVSRGESDSTCARRLWRGWRAGR